MLDKKSDNWHHLPLWLRILFFGNFLDLRPTRAVARRIELVSHVTGFLFCMLGFMSEAALAGGLIMLATAYLFALLTWQGDKIGVWYEAPEAA